MTVPSVILVTSPFSSTVAILSLLLVHMPSSTRFSSWVVSPAQIVPFPVIIPGSGAGAGGLLIVMGSESSVQPAAFLTVMIYVPGATSGKVALA